MAIESVRLEQRRGMLSFDKITKCVVYYTANFPPLILAVFDVWGRVAETGSGNKWPLVAFKSARLRQLGDMLKFCKGLRVFSEHELTFTFAICYRPSVCRLSVVCNVRAPYSGGSTFRQYFYGIWYPSHPLTSTENFTEIVPREPLRRGS